MTINCKGQLLDLSSPKVMGILNITPDSFYAASRNEPDVVFLRKAEKMLVAGASIIDVGGYSTRPGATEISASKELKRVLPAVELLVKNFPDTPISIDTFRTEVARPCLEAGVAMVNDISAGSLDKNMMNLVADFQVPYIMMHMRGNPQTMTQFCNYENLFQEIFLYFSEKINQARALGINDLIIDPGFGFSKTIDQNFELLSRLEMFQIMELPLLAGLSRKSTIYKTLVCEPEEALNGTTVLNTVALMKGATILRVHDVKEAIEAVKLTSRLNN